jgi:hypothetical protein
MISARAPLFLANCCSTTKPTMNDTLSVSNLSSGESEKVDLAIQIDKELLDQVNHLTADPGKVIEVALRQWLKGDRRAEDDLVRRLPRNPTVPPKGEWND